MHLRFPNFFDYNENEKPKSHIKLNIKYMTNGYETVPQISQEEGDE